MRLIILIALVISALLVTASALAGKPDPRKCYRIDSNNQPTTELSAPSTCARTAAMMALERKLAILHPVPNTVLWQGPVNCHPGDQKFLLWQCGYGQDYATDPSAYNATVKFWATKTGWHTLVTIL